MLLGHGSLLGERLHVHIMHMVTTDLVVEWEIILLHEASFFRWTFKHSSQNIFFFLYSKNESQVSQIVISFFKILSIRSSSSSSVNFRTIGFHLITYFLFQLNQATRVDDLVLW